MPIKRYITIFLSISVITLIVVFLNRNQNSSQISKTPEDSLDRNNLQTAIKRQDQIQREHSAAQNIDSESAIVEQFKLDLENGLDFALQSLKERDFVQYSARISMQGVAEAIMSSGEYEFFDVLTTLNEIFGEKEFEFLTTHLSAQLLRHHSHDQNPLKIGEFLAGLKNRAIFQLAAQDAGIGLVKDKSNPLEVLQQLEQTPNLEDNNLILKGALKQFLKEDPEAFTQYLSNADQWTNAHDEAVYAVYTNYTTEDPTTVMQWLELIQNEELRDKAIYGTAINLARDSPDTFQTWISSLPDGKLKDEILDSTGE